MKEDCEQGEEKRERERGEEKKGEKEVERGERLESKKEREGGREIVYYSDYIFDQEDKVVLSRPLAYTSPVAPQTQLRPIHCWAGPRPTLNNTSTQVPN